MGSRYVTSASVRRHLLKIALRPIGAKGTRQIGVLILCSGDSEFLRSVSSGWAISGLLNEKSSSVG